MTINSTYNMGLLEWWNHRYIKYDKNTDEMLIFYKEESWK